MTAVIRHPQIAVESGFNGLQQRSVHDVPDETLNRIREPWETFDYAKAAKSAASEPA